MDIISQLQEQVSTIAGLAVNTYGTLQRDAPPVRLSPNYPEPPPPTTVPADETNFSDQPKLMSFALVDAAKKRPPTRPQNCAVSRPSVMKLYKVDAPQKLKVYVLHAIHGVSRPPGTDPLPIHREPFDALVTALPLSEGGEEAQLRRIAELQAENDIVGQELQKQLEAAENELKQVQELFSQAADSSLNLKKPD